MAEYSLNCFWNPKWMPKIGTGTEANPAVYNLEHQLYGPQSLETPSQLPGMQPGTSGFKGGDHIFFAFFLAEESGLTSVTIQFQGNNTKAPANPLGMSKGNNGSQVSGGNLWEYTCLGNNLASTTNGWQLFQDASSNSTFTFATPNSTWPEASWVLAIEAVYGSGASQKTFKFDPVWKVGTGG